MTEESSDIILIGDDPDGIYQGATPEGLRALHPRWERDIRDFGPFEAADEAVGSFRALSGGGFGAHSGPNSGPVRGERPSLLVCSSCGSTMDAAWKLLEQGRLGAWDGVVSAVQTSGRGQLRRPWSSPPGNLHLSLVLPGADDLPAGTPDPDPGTLLPLMIGYLVCRFLEDFGFSPSMKWPNDVLVRGRKVSGILVEDRGGRTIAGIGLNIDYAPPDSELRVDHAVPASCLDREGADLTPLGAAVKLVNRGQNWYVRLLNLSSPQGRITEIEKRIAWLGEHICLENTSGAVRGRMVGLGGDGGLILESDGHKDVFYSGSIRPVT